MTFGCIQDSTSIRNEVESAIEFIINVLHSDFAVPFYQDGLKDKHSRLWETFCNSTMNNRVSVENYMKHFILDYAKSDLNVSFDVSLDHFLLNEDIKRIVKELGYHTNNDMVSAKFNLKTLYRDADHNDVPAWMTNSTSKAMPYKILN